MSIPHPNSLDWGGNHNSNAIIFWQYWSHDWEAYPLHTAEGELAEDGFFLSKDNEWTWIWRAAHAEIFTKFSTKLSCILLETIVVLTWNLGIGVESKFGYSNSKPNTKSLVESNEINTWYASLGILTQQLELGSRLVRYSLMKLPLCAI